MTFASLREQGFRKALQEAGLQPEDCPVRHTELSSASGQQVAQELLALARRPSAILCATDSLALGVMAAVREAGLQVGRDVSVMGYGNSEAGQFAQPPLASIDHAIVENGRHIAQLLLRVMAAERPADLHILETPNLLIRDSVGPCLAEA
jgi:LacI family transcriptional regulator